jgi:hypothetical protein
MVLIEDSMVCPQLQCASNKWKVPIELSKLEVPQVPSPGTSASSANSSSAPGADDKAMGMTSGNEATICAPILLPASEFQILLVPVETDAARQRRHEAEEPEVAEGAGPLESPYCQLLSEILHISPFRLPVEYEKRALVKVERMKNIQAIVKKDLTEDQQRHFEEELNRGFRNWLISSGNLRQVLDLVHLERRGGV